MKCERVRMLGIFLLSSSNSFLNIRDDIPFICWIKKYGTIVV